MRTHLLRLGPGNTAASGIKGHAKQKHLDQGIITNEDLHGNDNADTLAGVGRDLWQVPLITRVGHLTRRTASMIV